MTHFYIDCALLNLCTLEKEDKGIAIREMSVEIFFLIVFDVFENYNVVKHILLLTLVQVYLKIASAVFFFIFSSLELAGFMFQNFGEIMVVTNHAQITARQKPML